MSYKKGTMKLAALLMSLILMLAGCGAGAAAEPSQEGSQGNGRVMILYTSDIHCAVDDGFGLDGLQAVRANLEADGYETILVDDGDAIQGEALGMLTDGEGVIDLMNSVKYDVAIPGNHEFDYGMQRFLELTEKADFPYVSCNFTKNDELVFEPYVIREAAGLKIAFVGVTTPRTLVTSNPENFEDENGKTIYGFMQGGSGEELYKAVQSAVDSARAEGADYVYVMGHLGYEKADEPYTYADVIANTNGIDVFLDGHSHDLEQVVMKNKDGDDVVRTACGTKLQAIGHSEISAEEGIMETDIWTWNNDTSAADLLGIDNDVTEDVDSAMDKLNRSLDEVIGTADVELTVNDPEVTLDDGTPVRIVRRGETNLGDLCADAIRVQLGADIGISGAGSIRSVIDKGDITYGKILEVFPFSNEMCVIEVTGQQMLDALEWGAHKLPGEFGGFLQVSGLTYEIDLSVSSPCMEDETGMFTGISGKRRIRNVTVDGKPIDPEALYTVAGQDYHLVDSGDGFSMFNGAKKVVTTGKLDNEIIIDYIKETLGGRIGADYADPYGQGRITIIQ